MCVSVKSLEILIILNFVLPLRHLPQPGHQQCQLLSQPDHQAVLIVIIIKIRWQPQLRLYMVNIFRISTVYHATIFINAFNNHHRYETPVHCPQHSRRQRRLVVNVKPIILIPISLLFHNNVNSEFLVHARPFIIQGRHSFSARSAYP